MLRPLLDASGFAYRTELLAFLPAYGAMRVLAEPLLESVPQTSLQLYIFWYGGDDFAVLLSPRAPLRLLYSVSLLAEYFPISDSHSTRHAHAYPSGPFVARGRLLLTNAEKAARRRQLLELEARRGRPTGDLRQLLGALEYLGGPTLNSNKNIKLYMNYKYIG